MKSKIVLLLIFVGILFKILDDVYDNPGRFPSSVETNKDILGMIFVSLSTLLVTIFQESAPLLVLVTIHGFVSDKLFGYNNIDNRLWKSCAFVSIILLLFFVGERQTWKIFSDKHESLSLPILAICILGLLALIEMKYFKEEYSLLKILFRIFVSISFFIFLITKRYHDCFNNESCMYSFILVLFAYSLTSVFNMIYLYIDDYSTINLSLFTPFEIFSMQLNRLILELECIT